MTKSLSLKNKNILVVFLGALVFLLAFEGLSKWLYANWHKEDLLIDPHAVLPSALEWIASSLLWVKVWLRAIALTLLYGLFVIKFWRPSAQHFLIDALILILAMTLQVFIYQLFVFNAFSFERLEIFKAEFYSFLLVTIVYFSPIAIASAWYLKKNSIDKA